MAKVIHVVSNPVDVVLLGDHAEHLTNGKYGVRAMYPVSSYTDAKKLLEAHLPEEGRLVLVTDTHTFKEGVGRVDVSDLMRLARKKGGSVVLFYGGRVTDEHIGLANHDVLKTSHNLGCPDTYHKQVLAPVLAEVA